MEYFENAFWTEACIFIGGHLRYLWYGKKSQLTRKEYVNSEDQMRMNLLVGNLILVPTVIIGMWFTFKKYN